MSAFVQPPGELVTPRHPPEPLAGAGELGVGVLPLPGEVHEQTSGVFAGRERLPFPIPRLIEHDARVRVYRLRPERFGVLRGWLEEVEAFWAAELSAFKTHAERTRARRQS